MTEQLFARFQSHLDETTNPSDPFVTASRVLDYALTLLREFGCPMAPSVIEAAGLAFDSYVRPIDWKWIPEIVERELEDKARDALVSGLTNLSKRICDESDPDVFFKE